MISSLSGKLIIKSPTKLVIEVNGVGFEVNISLSTYQKIGPQNASVSIFTYLHVRDESLQLFGFSTQQERRFFLMLISISGIGPKLAQLILSGATVQELKTSILEEDVATLIAIPGIGRKTAQRIIFDLKEKIASDESFQKLEQSLPADEVSKSHIYNEAVQALISLGYSKSAAENAINTVRKKFQQIENTEDIIKKALSDIK
ncbi:Holliday junction branch migration protein RuvA [candidate division KSB1 bacterium]|nr:Holliday junction branch migration protein RuvA [candidate division KSB1 bacterium]